MTGSQRGTRAAGTRGACCDGNVRAGVRRKDGGERAFIVPRADFDGHRAAATRDAGHAGDAPLASARAADLLGGRTVACTQEGARRDRRGPEEIIIAMRRHSHRKVLFIGIRKRLPSRYRVKFCLW